MKSILILGAASDVGRAFAEEWAKNGFQVILAGRSEEKLNSIASDIEIRFNVQTSVEEFDALKEDSHTDFYNKLSPKPEVVVCVFGYLGDQDVAEKDWTETDRILRTNFNGAVSILNAVSEDMRAKGEGSIIGISSVAGERGRQSNYIYGSAKAGLTAYLSGLRNSLYHSGVHVMTVKPGFINTKMTEGLKLPAPLTAEPAKMGKYVFRACRKKKNVIYYLPIWRLIMLIIRNIPETVFKKLKM